MPRTEASKGRPHDSKKAQEAILDAAEAAFADHGFAGARVDAIAQAAGYNKSLIFHYFGDKLGLYTAVIQRADQRGREIQKTIFDAIDSDDSLLTKERFRGFLERAVRLTFDYYVANPQQLRVWAWEEAAGWKTLNVISSQLDHSDVDQLLDLLERAHCAGLLRPDLSPRVVMYVLINLMRSYHTSLPLFQLIAPEDLSSPESLARARDEIITFIVHGLIADPCPDRDRS